MDLFANLSQRTKVFLGIGLIFGGIALFGGIAMPYSEYRRYKYAEKDMEILFKKRKEADGEEQVKDIELKEL